MKTKQFLQKLKKQGAETIKSRGKGGHYVVRLNGYKTIVKFHGDRELSNVYCKLVCKQLNINYEDL